MTSITQQIVRETYAQLKEKQEVYEAAEQQLLDEIEQLKEQFWKRHADEYNEFQIARTEYELATDDLKREVLQAWQDAGSPDKGKTFADGIAQIRVNQKTVHYDEGAALAYCEEHYKGLVIRQVDKRKFEKAVRERMIENISADVIRIEPEASVIIITKMLDTQEATS